MATLSSQTANAARTAPATLTWPNPFTELHHRQPARAPAAQLFLPGAVPCLIAMALDPRTANDIHIWVKLAKFCISLALYFATLA